MNNQKGKFSFKPSISLSDKRKWMLAVTFFEATNSVFRITNKNIFFPITLPSYWSWRGGSETIIKLREFLRLRAQNDIELHVKEVKKRGNQIKVGGNEYKLSDLDIRETEINKEIKDLDNNDFKYMVFRMEWTYNEIENTFDMIYFEASTTEYTLEPGIYEISDI